MFNNKWFYSIQIYFLIIIFFKHVNSYTPISRETAFGLDTSENMTIFRLPNDTEPISYKLRFIPLENLYIHHADEIPNIATYYGEVDIKILVHTEISRITLNCVNLKMYRVELTKASGFSLAVKNFSFSLENEQMYVDMEQPLVPANTYILYLKFNGEHSNNMKGFYQSFFKINGQLRAVAATHFEPTYARTAFPCYDEPRFKTPFEISIARKEDQIVLSNKPVKITANADYMKRIWDTFEETPKIPTYMVAVAVVTSFSNNWSGGGKFHLFTRDDVVRQTDHAIGIIPSLIEKLEYITGLQYMLPKIDLVTIPDFAADAMGNYGLITLRESACLNSFLSPAKSQISTTLTIAHEMANQWFGDLLTPIWWDHLWLSEAFATYYGYLTAHWMAQDWRINEFFVVDILQPALRTDGISVHHPVLMSNIQSPAEINKIFDEVTYYKGASILRMLKECISDDTFNKAIRLYLKSAMNQGGYVEHKRLLEALQDQVNMDHALPESVPLIKFMDSWTKQVGYPLITVTRNYRKQIVEITQRPYNSSRSRQSVPADQLWYVPISYATSLEKDFYGTRPKFWLTNSTMKVEINAKYYIWNVWILLNVQQIGYYRVNYDETNWALIQKQLFNWPGDVSAVCRAQIVDDVLNLAFDDILDFKTMFFIISYLQKEMDELPWTAAIRGFNFLTTIYQDSDLKVFLEIHFAKLMSQSYIHVGMENPGYDDIHGKNLRRLLCSGACENNLSRCVNDAKKIYQSFTTSGKVLAADIIPSIFCTAIRNGDDEEWNAVYTFYLNNQNNPSIAEQVLPTFGCSTDEPKLQKLLQMQFNNKLPLRRQDHVHVLTVIQNYNGANAALTIIKQRLRTLRTMSDDDLAILINMLNALGTYGCTDHHLITITDILNSRATKDGPKAFSDAVQFAYEGILSRNKWRNEHYEVIKSQITDWTTTTSTTEEETTPPPTETTPIPEETLSTTEYPTSVTEYSTSKSNEQTTETHTAKEPKSSSATAIEKSYISIYIIFICFFYNFF